MSRKFLLATSGIFENSLLIDNVRQSYMDINEETDIEVVQELVNDALTYLEKDHPENIVNELFSLILKCFTYFSDHLLPTFNTIFEKSKINSNYIITTATVLPYLINEKPDLKLPEYNSFVNDAINEIRPQIQNSDITIFSHKIPIQFKYNLIINLLLCSNITKELISDFLPYIFDHFKIADITTVSKFVKILSEKDLISTFPKSILNDFDSLAKLSDEVFAYFIPYIPDQIFIQNITVIGMIITTKKHLSSLFSANVIRKCSKLNFDLSLSHAGKLFASLKISDITPEICEYIKKYKIYFSSKKSKELLECPHVDIIYDKLSSTSLFTIEQMIQIVKEKTQIEAKDLTNFQFYIDIYSHYSKNKFANRIIEIIVLFIKKFIGKEKFNQLFEEMLFSSYPPTYQGASFLCMILSVIDKEYTDTFYSNEHMKEFTTKILDKKVVPIKNLSGIIKLKTKIEMLKQSSKNQNPILQYLYCYLTPKEIMSSDNDVAEITVMPQTSQSDEKLLEFYQYCDENKSSDQTFISTDLSDDCLSLVSCALILAKSRNKVIVNGLTKETVLQFYSFAAKVFNLYKNTIKVDFLDTISSPELISLLIEGVKLVSNNKSPIIIYSIDRIVKLLDSTFSENVKKQICPILAQTLLNNEYFADKINLLITILNNFKLVQIDDVIEYMFSHCSEIDFKSMNYSNKELTFNINKIEELVISRIQDSSLTVEELINMINVICSSLKDVLKLDLKQCSQILLKFFDQVFNENKYEESYIIADFMIKNNEYNEIYQRIHNNEKMPSDTKLKFLQILPPCILNEDEMVTVFISDPKPESNDALIKHLFDYLMKEKPNVMANIITTIEFYDLPFELGPDSLLKLFGDKYEQYKDDFIISLDHFYELHPQHDFFLQKAKYIPYKLPALESNQKIIRKLFDLTKEKVDDYRPFFCLKCIAATHPLIFESNPQEIIDIVLPKLNDFHLLFTVKPLNETKEEEEERYKKTKTSIAAFSFLYTTLNSTKVIDHFVVWFMKHYKKITKSQLLCCIMLFDAITNLRAFLMALVLIKYNFAKFFTYILQVKNEKGYFSEFFNYSSYVLMIMFYNTVTKNTKDLSIFAYKIDKLNNIFATKKDNHLTISITQDLLARNKNLFDCAGKYPNLNTKMISFFQGIERNHKFWFVRNDPKNNNNIQISNEQISSFISHYRRLIPKALESSSNQRLNLPRYPTVKMTFYLFTQKVWINEYIFFRKKYRFLNDHIMLICETLEKFAEIEKTGKLSDDDDSNDIPLSSFNNYSFLNNKIYNENLLKNIVTKCKQETNEPFTNLCHLFEIMSMHAIHYNKFASIILSELGSYDKVENKDSAEIIGTIVSLINAFIFCLMGKLRTIRDQRMVGDIFSQLFIEIREKILDITLQPRYREDTNLLYPVYKFLNILPINLPSRVTHLIGFMLLTGKPDETIDALSLCSKLTVKDLQHMEIIQNTFDHEIEKQNPQMNIINAFLDYFPSVGISRRLEMKSRLESLLKEYKEGMKPNENQNQVIDNGIFDKFGLPNNFDFISSTKEMTDKLISDIIGSAEIRERDELANFIVTLLDFISPPRDLNNSFKMSDSTRLTQQRQSQDKNFEFYPIPDFIYESSPQFWKFFEENREIINSILLKKFKKNKIPDPYDITSQYLPSMPLFSSTLVSKYPECFSFEFRSTYFSQKMQRRINAKHDVKLNIDLENILDSSFSQLEKLPTNNWLLLFNVKYTNNIGADAGGLTKDWMSKLSSQIFNQDSELFQCLENNENYIIRQQKNQPDEKMLSKYRIIGMFVARSLIQGVLINAHLTRSLLKMILHHQIKVSDVEDADECLYKSLMYIKDNKIDDDPNYEQYFEVDTIYGETVELKPNGSKIKVNDENKIEFINLLAEYRLKKSVESQINAFCDGFDSLINHKDIRIFTPNELSLLICGVADINVDDLEKNICFRPPYNKETPVIKMFFEVIRSWDKQNLAKLLMFITGSLRVPSTGFKFFRDIKKPITIARDPDISHCPISHTCINTMNLPEYHDKEELNRKLLISINEIEFNLS